MKRTLASLIPLGLVFSATTYAAAPMLPEEIPVEEQERFVIGLEGHFFRQSQTDAYYAVTEDANDNEKIHYLDADYDLNSGRVFASYMFTNENDIQLSYTHGKYSDDDKTSVTTADAAAFGIGIPFIDLTDTDVTGALTVKLDKDTDLDIVDLDMGRVFHDEDYMVRVFAGVRYVMLDDEMKLTVDQSPTDFDVTKAESEMDGVGPRAGIDARFRLMDHVSLTGHVGVALLKSYIDSKTSLPDLVEGDGSDFTVKTDEIERLVPNADVRLGLAVDFMFDNGWGMVLEGGFHADHFWNASTVAIPGGLAFNRDVSVYGPYIGAAVMFS